MLVHSTPTYPKCKQIRLPIKGEMGTMVIRAFEFSSWVRKLERFLPKNQHTQRKLLNFENQCNGEVSKMKKKNEKDSDDF